MSILANKGISVFFPAFNDESTIGPLVRSAADTLRRLTSDFEIIVINDGSRDSTAEKLSELQIAMPFLRVVTHETNKGYGAALRSGITSTTKELVFYTDGDGQYDVGELEKLHGLMSEQVDVVNGYKLNRADGVHRKLIGGIYARFVRRVFRLPIRDVDCDFRLMRKASLERVELRSNSGAICVELVDGLARSGARFVEVGVNHYARESGRSQFFSLGRISKTLFDLFGLWRNRNRGEGRRDRPASSINRVSVTHK